METRIKQQVRDRGTDAAMRGVSTPTGRDELNLAEFPLCSLADRVEPGQKTLRFEDRTWDESRAGMITRQLTITGAAEYGLPTALDDEVLLGLIQLSKLCDFGERQVCFTRYQLLRLLGWGNDGKSYDRLEDSLNRWVGVTLYYQNAWWSREQRCWVDEKFHVLDNVTLCSRRKSVNRPGSGQCVQWPANSSFTWNDVIFRSFRAGNLKSLDFEFYKRLRSAIAKRLYRFLDKRFFHRRRCEFHLKSLACEHIGLARGYDVANLKRKLRPAIAELVESGFLEPLSEDERFRKVSSGDWRAVFERAEPKARTSSASATRHGERGEALADLLTARGVGRSTSAALISQFSAGRIQRQIEAFDCKRHPARMG